MDSVVESATSVAARGELPQRLLGAMEQQLDLIHEVIQRERAFQREVAAHLAAPVDAVLDLLEESGATLRRQAEALESAGRALEETATLMQRQAEVFEGTIVRLREPAELAKSVAGLERRPRRTARKRSG
jgi:hypothetical protein